MSTPVCEHLHLDVEGAVLKVGLSRESVYNALNTAMRSIRGLRTTR